MREVNERRLAECTCFGVTLGRVFVDGDEGALEWTWPETRRADGVRRSMDDAIVFVVRDGKIVYWREYFDPTIAREGGSTGT